jgi:hypothetical protein
MNRRLEPLACRIHDAVVTAGSDEEQEMAFDLYQKQAQQEPCPACEAIEGVLLAHEHQSVKGKLKALLIGAIGGFCLFLSGVCVMSTHYQATERWGAVLGLAGFGMALLWENLLRKRLV